MFVYESHVFVTKSLKSVLLIDCTDIIYLFEESRLSMYREMILTHCYGRCVNDLTMELSRGREKWYLKRCDSEQSKRGGKSQKIGLAFFFSDFVHAF